MKKLFLTLSLVLMLVFAFAACDSGDNGGTTPGGDNTPHTHAYGEWETTKEASCLEEGTKVRRCACLEQESETIPATGHSFGEWIVDTAATCQKTGTRHHICTVCNKSVSESYSDPDAHNYAATWTNDNTHHWHKCQNSGCTSVADKTAHTFGEWIVDTVATCQKTGTRHHICTVCNKSVSETYSDVNAHNYATTWTSDNTHHWHKCQNSGCTSVADKTAHTFGEWIVDKAATCQKTGTRHHVCMVCNKSVSESYSNPDAHNYATTWTSDATHHWRKCQNSDCTSVLDKTTHNVADGRCTECYKLTTYYRDGNYIYFGEYPQTIKAAGVTITSTQDARGYYLGSDGFYYAKVTAMLVVSGYTFSTGTTVKDGTVYYFKVEPIRWRILSENGDTALILCDSIIANKAFDDYKGGNCDNNYADSIIRAWLNDQFYNTAFNSLQKELINTVLVDNSAASTGYSSNPHACEDTNDKIFLLSYKEVTNSAYGFASSDSTYDTARRMTVSDYARATGACMSTSSSYYGNGYWWLRSPNYDHYYYYYYARGVSYDGSAGHYCVSSTYVGVVPALQIRLK